MLSGPAETCKPSVTLLREMGLPTRAAWEEARRTPGEAVRRSPRAAFPGRCRPHRHTPGRQARGGARRQLRAARTRQPARVGGGRPYGAGNQDGVAGLGREAAGARPQVPAERRRERRGVSGTSRLLCPRPATSSARRPPCASPPLVSTPMALPAPDIRSFSRSTVAMAAEKAAWLLALTVANPAPYLAPPRSAPPPRPRTREVTAPRGRAGDWGGRAVRVAPRGRGGAASPRPRVLASRGPHCWAVCGLGRGALAFWFLRRWT